VSAEAFRQLLGGSRGRLAGALLARSVVLHEQAAATLAQPL
jgi:hypothetical protein